MTITLKNACSGVGALAGGGLAVIVGLVPPEHLASWRWPIVALGAIVAITAVIQMLKSSSEDAKLFTMMEAVYLAHCDKAAPVIKETIALSVAEPPVKAKGIDGELLRAAVSPKTPVWGMVQSIYQVEKPNYKPKIDTDFLLEMYLVNKTDRPKFIREIEAYVTVDGKEIRLETQKDFYAYKFGETDFEYGVDDPGVATGKTQPLRKLEIDSSIPLLPEQPKEGWIRFLAKDINPEGIDSNTWRVFVIDSLKNKYQIMQTGKSGTPGEIGIRSIG